MGNSTRVFVAFFLFCLVVQAMLLPLAASKDGSGLLELDSYVASGATADTLCGIGIGLVAGSLFFLSGGVLGVVMAVTVPKAAAACIYWAVT